MNLIELQRALGQLRLGGMAIVLETRLRQAQAEAMAPIDLISCLVSDELTRRSDRLLERRRKQAAFRDPHRTLDNFDFTFNPKMNRSLEPLHSADHRFPELPKLLPESWVCDIKMRRVIRRHAPHPSRYGGDRV